VADVAIDGEKFDYVFYGLCVRADRALPGLIGRQAETSPDIEVSLVAGGGTTVPVPASAWYPTSPSLLLWKAPGPGGNFVRLRFSDSGETVELVMDPGGRRAWVSWTSGVTLEDLTSLVVGPMLGCLLQLRGMTCLHGCVVALHGRGFAFLGPSGAGKSTTALACIQAGATLVSDDLVVLDEGREGFRARYGQPALQLRPNSAQLLSGSFDQLRPIWSEARGWHPKRYVDVAPPCEGAESTTPLEAIYLLGPRVSTGRTPQIVRLSAAASVAMLLVQRPHWFLHDRDSDARDMEVLSRVATRVPVSELVRGEGLEQLAELVETLLAPPSAA
jgi:HPr serine kinase-like protein